MTTTTSAAPGDSGGEIASLTSQPSAWRKAPLDAIVLLALLVGANWFFGHEDPGWQRANPTPWILLPFFLGGRYGAAAGLAGALLAAIAVLTLQWALGNMTPQALFTAKPYFFLAFVIGAAVGTLVHRLVSGPADRLRRMALSLADRNQHLEEEASLHRANENHLQEALLLHGAETVSVMSEVNRLFTGDRGRFDDGLLELLAREFGVISAAIYRDDSGRHATLNRTATTSAGESTFPERLPDPGAPLADAARETGKIATWKSQWDGGIPDRGEADETSVRPHLAAIPWQRSKSSAAPGPRAILLIARMEFGNIRWETFAHIEAVFTWCLSRLEPGGLTDPSAQATGGRLLSRDAFAEQIDLARRLETELHLPGRLILFAADAEAPASSLESFAEQLGNLVPPGLPIGAVGDGKSVPLAIGFLDSSTSREAANLFARRILDQADLPAGAVKHHVFSLEEAVRIARGSFGGTGTQSHAAAPVSGTERPAPGNAVESASSSVD